MAKAKVRQAVTVESRPLQQGATKKVNFEPERYPVARGHDVEELEPSQSNYDELVAMEEFEKVWRMEDGDDEENGNAVDENNLAVPLSESVQTIERFQSSKSLEDDYKDGQERMLSLGEGSTEHSKNSAMSDNIIGGHNILPTSPHSSVSVYEDSPAEANIN